MLTLVLDSSTPAITAALVTVDGPNPTVLSEQITVDSRAHGELLAPSIEAVIRTAGVKVVDVGAIVAGLGPGPFTGLRVGLVTAATIADALTIPGYGVCSLDGIGSVTEGVILVATDARRREVYWAVYADGHRIAGPGVDRPADVAIRAKEFGVTGAVGDGAVLYADQLGMEVRDYPRYPLAAALAASASTRVLAGADTEALTPLYLRRPDVAEPGGMRKSVLRS